MNSTESKETVTGVISITEQHSAFYTAFLDDQRSPIYKPRKFRTTNELWEFLHSIGIKKLPELGVKVVLVEDLDSNLLETWGFVRNCLGVTATDGRKMVLNCLTAYVDPSLVEMGFLRKPGKLTYSRHIANDKIIFELKHSRHPALGYPLPLGRITCEGFSITSAGSETKIFFSFNRLRLSSKLDTHGVLFYDLLSANEAAQDLVTMLEEALSCLIENRQRWVP